MISLFYMYFCLLESCLDLLANVLSISMFVTLTLPVVLFVHACLYVLP